MVVHRNTARDSLDELARFFREDPRWSLPTFPYHFWIDKDGTVSQIHDWGHVTPHAKGLNSIGVAVCLHVDGRKERPNDKMYEALAQVLACFLQRYPGATMIGHSAIKRCPGPLVRLDHPRLQQVLREAAESGGGED